MSETDALRKTSTGFRVLSYNIHRAIGIDRGFHPERIIRIIESHNADIVLLQEVDEGVPRSREMDLARELARALGYPHMAVGHNVTLRKGRYGNATLSRHEILTERNIDLTVGLWKRRGCQHTAVLLHTHPKLRIDVFNLHLGLSARERARQVALLTASPEFRDVPPQRPCLVGGDFNDWRSLLVPLFAGPLNFKSATDRTSSLGAERPLLTYPSFFPRGPLDRIYYRGPLSLVAAKRCRLRLSRVASDHLPIIVDFSFL